MNIRIGGPEPHVNPISLLADAMVVKQAQETALAAVNDGYNHIVYNFCRKGGAIDIKDNAENFRGFDLLKAFMDRYK